MWGWFRRKPSKPVAFELHDGKGGVRHGMTTDERVQDLQAGGILGPKLEGCVSYYLDPRMPEPIERKLIIGEDIARETYEKFKDADGKIYVVGFLERDETKLAYVSKPLWDQMRRTLKSV